MIARPYTMLCVTRCDVGSTDLQSFHLAGGIEAIEGCRAHPRRSRTLSLTVKWAAKCSKLRTEPGTQQHWDSSTAILQDSLQTEFIAFHDLKSSLVPRFCQEENAVKQPGRLPQTEATKGLNGLDLRKPATRSYA